MFGALEYQNEPLLIKLIFNTAILHNTNYNIRECGEINVSDVQRSHLSIIRKRIDGF